MGYVCTSGATSTVLTVFLVLVAGENVTDDDLKYLSNKCTTLQDLNVAYDYDITNQGAHC
jgi:hypothetical protein